MVKMSVQRDTEEKVNSAWYSLVVTATATEQFYTYLRKHNINLFKDALEKLVHNAVHTNKHKTLKINKIFTVQYM